MTEAVSIGALASTIVSVMSAPLTAELLRRKLSYDPSTGKFHWRHRGRGVPDISKEAGRINGNGYREIGVNGRLYAANRLAWLYMTGEWPAGDVDHRDLDRANNCWGNLREATRAQNIANTGIRSTNRSGYKGVFASAQYPHRWQAQIRVNGKKKHLGSFSTPEEASAVYQRALIETHGSFGRF
jgi:hypothetical protein